MTREKDEIRLYENVIDDIFRHSKSFLKYCVVFALGRFSFGSFHSEQVGEITCTHNVTVELTGSTTFIVPAALPRTGAQG